MPVFWRIARLPSSLRYLGLLYAGLVFGNNEYRYQIYSDLLRVCDYEKDNGGIILDHSQLNSKDCQVGPGVTVSHLRSRAFVFIWNMLVSVLMRYTRVWEVVEQKLSSNLLIGRLCSFSIDTQIRMNWFRVDHVKFGVSVGQIRSVITIVNAFHLIDTVISRY